MSISKLDTRTANLIGSSVVITSVYSVIKELLENAVDAGATSINISMEKFGLNRIEVRDNGSGICHADIPLACLAGHTSKIQDFSDLDHLHSYGFRGQALNALCTVADLSFTTRTSDDDVAATYTLDKEGRIISSGPSYLGIGTTIIVKNLFVNLPVRRKMLSRSPSSLRTILWLLRCYSIAKPNLALSLVHDGSLVWKKCTAHALTTAVQEALGYKLSTMLHQMYWRECYHNSELPVGGEISENLKIEMDILVPKKKSSISEFCSSQTVEGIVLNEYLLINGRPVKHKKVEKMMTSCIGKGLASDFPNRKKPPWVLRLHIPSNQLDVNLESDKTKVFLQCEEKILHILEERILIYYGVQAPNADPSSQSLESQPPKETLASSKPTNEPQDTILINSSHHIDTNSETIDSTSKSDQNLLSQPPPSKQARIEVEELDTRSHSGDLNLGSVNPANNNQPFFSLEPFEISDSQISEIGPPRDLERDENVLDVSRLKMCTEELGLGSFRIEVLRKLEGTGEETANVDDGGSRVSENSSFYSTKPPKEVEEITKDKNIDEECGMSDQDIEVIMGTLNTFENAENENELDLDAWTRGKISTNGVPVEEPVKILQSKPNHQPTSEIASAPKLITNKQLSTAPFKMLDKAAMPTKSSANDSSGFNERTSRTGATTSALASPLPNACSQLGRQDMRGFDCFASKTRPKIIAEQPGILFTSVASELAKRWEALSDGERAEFKKEGIAKAAARHKSTNPGLEMESSLPWKTAQKLPMILSEKVKQETLWKSMMKEKQEKPNIPAVGKTMKVTMNEVRKKFIKWDESTPEEQLGVMADERLLLVGQLKPSGMWVYKQGKDIGILRHFALQELIVYQKLMHTLSIPILPLTVPIVFDERTIGTELWKKFLSLESHYDAIKQQTLVTSELIAKNGFQISLLQGSGESDSSALITGIASVFSPYGVDDLKEVLQIIDSSGGNLSKCRTLQISNYIESEAIRMCRQSSPVMPRHDVLSLLTQWNGRPKCLHSQPVLVPFQWEDQPSETIFN